MFLIFWRLKHLVDILLQILYNLFTLYNFDLIWKSVLVLFYDLLTNHKYIKNSCPTKYCPTQYCPLHRLSQDHLS